jgi:hypothetical protein
MDPFLEVTCEGPSKVIVFSFDSKKGIKKMINEIIKKPVEMLKVIIGAIY